ncbi:DNA-binding NtrC family response regulator, partial [Ancylobacter polymorphus]
MTADMPDAVEEIAAIIRDYSSKPYTVEASRNAARAILGARAMQAAMAAQGGGAWEAGELTTLAEC